MEYKFINLIPLYALIVDKLSGEIKYVNNRIKNDFKIDFTHKHINEIINIKNFKENGIEFHTHFNPFNMPSQIGATEIQLLENNKDVLITFKESIHDQDFTYKDIFNKALEGLVVVNKKLHIIDVNDIFCEIVEIPKEKLVNRSAFNLAYKYAHPSTIKSLIKNLKYVFTGNSFKEFNLKYLGKTLSISMSFAKGDPYVIGIVRDISEKVNADIRLQRNEEKYKTLVNSSLDGINIIVDGKFVFVNPMMCKLFGYTESELLGMHFINIVAEEEKQRAFESFSHINPDSTEPHQYQSIGITKSNKKIYVDVIAVPMKYYGDQAMQVILRDITDKVKTIEELKASEEKFKFFTKSTYEGLVVHDKGTILDVNDAFTKITGYTKEDSIGENLLDYISDFKDKATAIFMMAQKNANPYIIKVNKKNGDNMFVELEAKDVLHKGKKVRIAAVRDVTEKERIKRKLLESEKRYRAVFENTGAASCIIEEDGTISLANSKFAELSGYKINEILNMKKWMEFVDPKDLSRMLDQHRLRRKNTKKALQQYEFTFIDKKKRKKEILLVIDIIEGSGKSVASLLDITYLKKTENELLIINKELKNAKEKAEESDQLKSAFLANMSHEIRTPMNGILGFADLLEEPDITGEEQKQYVEVIKRGGQRMLDTVNDLIDISKIETGQVQIHISAVNINKEINSLYQFFKPEAENKGLKLIWNKRLSEDKEIIQTDDQKLISILSNLIKNAIKYSDNGHIEIQTSLKKKYIYFNIIDTGIGIPKNRQKAVFNRFEQVDFTDTRAFDGSGLGLAISKAYVEILGGKIACKSDVGKGSDFHFYLPVN